MKLPIERLLAMLEKEMGSEFVLKQWQRTIEFEAEKVGLTVRELLYPLRLWDRYREIVRAANQGKLSVGKSADLLRQLQVSIEIDGRSRPWSQFAKGKTACVVMGDRSKFEPEESNRLRHRYAGAGDIIAHVELMRIAQHQLQLSAIWELQFVPADMSLEDAERRFKELTSRKDIGAIFALGSPFTNPFADLIARHIMQETDVRLPAKRLPFEFRWTHVPKSWPGTVQYLSSNKEYGPDSEGICLPTCGTVPTFKRSHDSEILKAISSRELAASYPDCGALVMSCRASEPIHCLMAGHGPSGTVAAVLALQQQSTVAELLEDTSNEIPEDVAFAIVEVHRTKPTLDSIDDLMFDREYGKGWSICFPDLNSESPLAEVDPKNWAPG